MTGLEITEKEKTFADELARYQNKWVAIVRSGADERIVGSGKGILGAKRSAEKKGIKNAVYMKVPSSNKVLIASYS